MHTIDYLKIQSINSSRQKGGSYFTMLIFIMLLISTALMYYYFQRTQFLERQITAMQNGEMPEPGGFSELISWVKGSDTDSNATHTIAEPPKSTPRPLPQATPETAVISEGDSLVPDGSEGTSLSPITTETAPVLEMPADETIESPSEATENMESEAIPEETPSANQPINSLYDTGAAPAVRVRSPQRRQ